MQKPRVASWPGSLLPKPVERSASDAVGTPMDGTMSPLGRAAGPGGQEHTGRPLPCPFPSDHQGHSHHQGPTSIERTVTLSPSPAGLGRPSTITFATALGRLHLAWTATGVDRLCFTTALDRERTPKAPAWVHDALMKLMAHLGGNPQDLSRIPLDLSNLTPFQRRVAEVLRATRPGQTLSYGDVALLCGRPGAARAVGQAVKANPILILVPCHRVVATQGPGGWSAFGSPEIKQRLLQLDRIIGNGEA